MSGVFTILGDLYNPETRTWNLSGEHILRQQDLWFVTGMTMLYVEVGIPPLSQACSPAPFSVLIPAWVCVREVPVDIELVSPSFLDRVEYLSAMIVAFAQGCHRPL